MFVMEVADRDGGVGGDGAGWGRFAVEKREGIPAGDYSIEIQFSRNGRSIGHGYGVKVRVIEESGRKRMVLDPEASREHPEFTYF